MRYPLARAVLLTLLLGALAAPGPGATRTWDAGGDKVDWFDEANWDPDGSPKRQDNLMVEFGSPVDAWIRFDCDVYQGDRMVTE